MAVVGLAALALLVAGCGSGDDGAASSTTAGATEKAPSESAVVSAVQAGAFKTYGIPDDWAGYGGMIKAYCAFLKVEPCHRTDTDTDSAETLRRFAAERNKPGALLGGVGVTFMEDGSKQGVLLDYTPERAKSMPAWTHVPGGVVTYTGAIAFVVNTDVIKDVPQTWDDLKNPAYKGKVGVFDPRESATGLYTLLAANAAKGGRPDGLSPGLNYFHALRETGNLSANRGDATAMERGDVPIQVTRDFQGVQMREALKAKGINVTVLIPKDGSIYAPDALVLNKFAAPNDIGRSFSDFVLSDAGQLEYAKYGARPIRQVLGDLKVPAADRALWLPDSEYAKVDLFDDWKQIDSATIAQQWEQKVLG